jgi:hypothetical protein
VGAHEGGYEGEGKLFPKAPHSSEDLELVRKGKAIPGFDLHGGHPLGQHAKKAGFGLRHKFLFACVPCGVNSGEDSATRVFFALSSGEKLLDAISRENRVGVGIHKPRSDTTPIAIKLRA